MIALWKTAPYPPKKKKKKIPSLLWVTDMKATLYSMWLLEHKERLGPPELLLLSGTTHLWCVLSVVWEPISATHLFNQPAGGGTKDAAVTTGGLPSHFLTHRHARSEEEESWGLWGSDRWTGGSSAALEGAATPRGRGRAKYMKGTTFRIQLCCGVVSKQHVHVLYVWSIS